MSGTDLKDLVVCWRELYAARQELERVSDEIKKHEDNVTAKIIDHMSVHGQDGVKLPDGVGTVTKVIRKTVFMKDAETACKFMYENMKEAAEKGTPFVNHLITQKQAHQSKVMDWAKARLEADNLNPNDFNNLQKILNSAGFDIHETVKLHFAQARA
jgi:hypothetical protein